LFEKNARAGRCHVGRLRKKLLLLVACGWAAGNLEQKFFWFFFFKKRTAFYFVFDHKDRIKKPKFSRIIPAFQEFPARALQFSIQFLAPARFAATLHWMENQDHECRHRNHHRRA
jgi:hypothetical protein